MNILSLIKMKHVNTSLKQAPGSMEKDIREAVRVKSKGLDRPYPGGRSLPLVVAFAMVYLVWGSTYLAIRFAIETIPPFFMTGTRFLIAGSILYSWARFRGASRPTLKNWWNAALIGLLLPTIGNGGVVWAEQFVPSGIAALLIATMPLWMILVDAIRPGGTRPDARVIGGLVLGFGGVALLIGPGTLLRGGEPIDPVGAMALLVAAFSWACGSVFSRYAALPPVPLQAASMEMLAGGAVLIVMGLLTGEVARMEVTRFSARSILSLAYLTVFGSIMTYVAYIWLLKNTSTASASTYAYVNPVVAIFLGWMLAGEAIGPRTFVAAVIIVGSVAMILGRRRRPPALSRTEADRVTADKRR